MRVPAKVMKVLTPIVIFFIKNFAQEIVIFIVDELKTFVNNKKTKEMEEALKKARDAENSAEKTTNEKEKLKFYEIAEVYKNEAKRKQEFIQDFNDSLNESRPALAESVQEKVESLNEKEIFRIEENGNDIKLLDENNKEIKIKGKRKLGFKKKKESKE